MTDPPPSACPVCGAGPVEKRLFPVAVHFKGSGFYSTDYGRGKTRARDGESGAPAEKATEKAVETKAADTKPKPSTDSG
jgi:predicted nucleic acid-binding Zn ribbon protein